MRNREGAGLLSGVPRGRMCQDEAAQRVGWVRCVAGTHHRWFNAPLSKRWVAEDGQPILPATRWVPGRLIDPSPVRARWRSPVISAPLQGYVMATRPLTQGGARR